MGGDPPHTGAAAVSDLRGRQPAPSCATHAKIARRGGAGMPRLAWPCGAVGTDEDMPHWPVRVMGKPPGGAYAGQTCRERGTVAVHTLRAGGVASSGVPSRTESHTEEGTTTGVLGDATAWTLFGMIFDSVTPGQAATGHSAGVGSALARDLGQMRQLVLESFHTKVGCAASGMSGEVDALVVPRIGWRMNSRPVPVASYGGGPRRHAPEINRQMPSASRVLGS
jgi:hypothetical protein